MNVKQIITSTLFASTFLSVLAQPKKPAVTNHAGAPKAAAAPVQLKTSQDSLSYAIGISLAGFYKKQNINTINTAVLNRAINDVLKNGKPIMSDEQCNTFMMGYMQKAQSSKASVAKKAGTEFLAANKNKPGIITLPSGLQYLVVKAGNGPKPAATDMVRVHYHGTLIDGRVFDSSVDRGEPIELAVNRVIPGWTEALQLMPVGSKWKLFIPSNLAYGDQQAGELIAPGSTLVFDVELLAIVNPNNPPAGGAAKPDSTTKSDSTQNH